MTTNIHGFRQKAYAIVAVVVATALGVTSLAPQFAGAAGQVQSRSIQLSDSGASGGSITSGIGSGTAVTYNVKFSVTSTATIGGIVVDICDSTPLIGDTTCTYPTGFNWGSATPSLTAGYTGIGAGWTAAASAGGGGGNFQVLKLSNATPQATAIATPVNFNITGVTNPNTQNHTYYARIVTFDTTANMANYTTVGTARAASFAGQVDYGGVALSTANPISITARVMESMSLCTSLAAPTQNCGGLSSPVLTLGHGGNLVLDASAVDTGTVYSQISTNATNGYAIRVHSNNACGGLSKDGGATCPIPAVNAGSSTAAAITAGTAAFGLKATAGAAVGTGTGTNSVTATYSSGVNYGFDTTTAGNNATSTYGSLVIDGSNAQANSVNNSYTFAATASNTTPAGIYTAYESLIATGTF